MGICFACELNDMFSGFDTVRKASWLKLTQFQCPSDRKDAQMLPRSIRESKTLRVANDNPTCTGVARGGRAGHLPRAALSGGRHFLGGGTFWGAALLDFWGVL